MLAFCFNLIGLSSRLTNLVPVACMNAVRTSFAYCFQIAGDIYVLFLELVAWNVTSFFLLLQFRKTNLHPYLVNICLFLFVVCQQLFNPLANWKHVLRRKIEFLEITNGSHLPKNRKGEKCSVHIRVCAVY